MGPAQSKIAARPASSNSETIRLKVGSCRAVTKRLGLQPIDDDVPPNVNAVQSAVGERVGVMVGAMVEATMLAVGSKVGRLVGDRVRSFVVVAAAMQTKKQQCE